MPPSYSIRIDDRDAMAMLARARLRQDPLLREGMVVIGELIKGDLQAAAPRSASHRDRGATLADSFKIRNRPDSVFVASYKKYAAIMEVGGHTKPHMILPKRAGGLAFNGIVRKSVHHPGGSYAGKHFAADVARKNGAIATEMLAAAVMRSFD